MITENTSNGMRDHGSSGTNGGFRPETLTLEVAL